MQLINASHRAFPDISLSGHNYAVYFGQAGGSNFWIPTDGTSCATPVVAGIMAVIKAKLGRRLGFVNPLLFKIHASHPSAFHDVTAGNNKCSSTCCGPSGFPAAEGWDAVTGLGTPDTGALLQAMQAVLAAAA